eukprot:scaffold24789_cov122-Isochrysis_galbana.AAC.2
MVVSGAHTQPNLSAAPGRQIFSPRHGGPPPPCASSGTPHRPAGRQLPRSLACADCGPEHWRQAAGRVIIPTPSGEQTRQAPDTACKGYAVRVHASAAAGPALPAVPGRCKPWWQYSASCAY